MMLHLTATAATELTSSDDLAVSLTYKDPITSTQQQATLLIRCTELLPLVKTASTAAFDLFLLAACTYGVDRMVQRRPNSVDGWSRELTVTFPVRNVKLWQSHQTDLQNLLSFLTGDYWTVQFSEWAMEWPASTKDSSFAETRIDQVNLFSGGLDSLIGAIDQLAKYPDKNILLVSHYDQDIKGAKGDQNDLYPIIAGKYGAQLKRIEPVAVHLSSSTITGRETTLRSRSLMFISLGVLASTTFTNCPPVIVPENGSVSLNFPLSSSRRSACSTRTTHPRLLSNIQDLLKKLSLQIEIKNPYEWSTKGQMVGGCEDPVLLRQTVALSNSCGKRGHRTHWSNPTASHCGICMPCVYRQAALSTFTDETTYGNVFGLKRREDILACQEFLNKPLSRKDIRKELLINGLTDLSKLDRYAEVVEQTRDELRHWTTSITVTH